MKKILVVDDNALMRSLLNITLNVDYEVIEASSGEDAIAKVRSQKPDAVLLDVMMPGRFDGLQVLEFIRKDPSRTQTLVAMVSARGLSLDRSKGSEMGADAYFVKPFSPLTMVRWLSEKFNLQGKMVQRP